MERLLAAGRDVILCQLQEGQAVLALAPHVLQAPGGQGGNKEQKSLPRTQSQPPLQSETHPLALRWFAWQGIRKCQIQRTLPSFVPRVPPALSAICLQVTRQQGGRQTLPLLTSPSRCTRLIWKEEGGEVRAWAFTFFYFAFSYG